MSSLKFIYASMNSGKSLTLITKRYALIQKGFSVVTLKPSTDTRSDKIETRLGLSAECHNLDSNVMPSTVVLSAIDQKPDFVLIDEAQFLTEAQVLDLAYLVDNWGIDVIAYGLKVSWKGDFFEGSYHLFRLADELEPIENYCPNNKGALAFFHIKDLENSDDSEVTIGHEEIYRSVSRKEWMIWAKLNNLDSQ